MAPAYGTGVGDFYEGFVAGEAQTHETTLEALRQWQPPQKKTGKKKAARKTKKQAADT